MPWISCKEAMPDDGKAVIYFFEHTGVSRGKYAAEDNCFYGKDGFLCGDVTHWMPDEGQDLPARPEGY